VAPQAIAPQQDDTQALIHPALAGVAVTGNAAAAAQAVYDQAVARLEAATAARIAAETELVALADREAGLTSAIGTETAARKAAATALVAARRQMQEAAINSYVVSTDQNDVTAVLDVDSTVSIGTVQTYSDSVSEDRLRLTEEAADEVLRASRALDEAQRERVEVRARTVEVTAAREAAAADEVTFTAEVAVRLVERDRARATSTVRGVDFSLVALDAYWRAAEANAECGIEWWALAGISRVEGRHGTYGGSRLLANGDVSRPIIGIALTGEGGTAAIGDSDGGALDGDATYDRAVGPMQFIPQTWARFRADGDGDGDRDPQNLYDSAAAAAEYLCHGRRLDSEAGIRAGYFSYNHSEAYVEAVLGHAYRYRTLRIPNPAR
jgi:membrane-bound lytic murein transglycosylase B